MESRPHDPGHRGLGLPAHVELSTPPPDNTDMMDEEKTPNNQQVADASTSPAAPKQSGSAASPSAPAGRRRGRVALACQRCKRRKQRCDGEQPACKGCKKANVQCLYERVIRPRYPGGKSLYISALEERIAFLEARIPEYAKDHFEAGSNQTPSPAAGVPSAPRRKHSRRLFADPSDDEDSPLVDGVAYLSLCASGVTDTAPEPFYLGSSSGATIARMIQSSIFRSSKLALPDSISPGDRDVLRPSSPIDPTRPSVLLADGSTCEFPPPAEAQVLFEVFFNRLHTRWPILDRKEYQQLFDQQYEHGALSVQQRSIFHLIYSISSRFLQLTKKRHLADPQVHFAAAIEPMDYILEQHNLATVQFLILLVIHGQQSPYGSGSWSQIRYALTMCVELGLHRMRSAKVTPTQSERGLEIRRRVFWACYCLDRTTSLLLGRTFGISDRDINVELPSSSTEFWNLTSTGEAPGADNWSNILPFIHIIKLKKLQSKIHRTVFRVDKDVLNPEPLERAKQDKKIASIHKALDDWAADIPNPPRDAKCATGAYDQENTYHHDSRDFFTLQYHKTVLSLFAALLPTLSTSDPRFISGAKSAARVCTAYKRLHQHKTLSYSIAALHSCFTAGLTLVYCLWRDASLFSYQALEAVRACSLCLTIFGEKWPGAVKYRDIFDALSASLFKAIVDPKDGSSGESTPAVETPSAAVDEDDAAQGRRKPLEITMQRKQRSSLDSVTGGPGRDDDQSTDIHGQTTITDSSPTTMMLEAVKDTFMEVDEEAPGGWQSWRMFNEMVQQGPESDTVQGLTIDATLLHQTQDTAMGWEDDMQVGNADFAGGDFRMIDGFTTNDIPQQWN